MLGWFCLWHDLFWLCHQMLCTVAAGLPHHKPVLQGTEGWAEVLPPGLVVLTGLLFGFKWATSPITCLTVGSCRKPGQPLKMQLCCKTGLGLGACLPSPALCPLCKAAAPPQAGDRNVLGWVYLLMGTTLRVPGVCLDPQHLLAVTAVGAEKMTSLGCPNSLWFPHGKAPVLVLTKAHVLWVCLQVFTEKNLLRFTRQDDLSPAQLGAGFLPGASSEQLGTEAETLSAAAHAWHISAWR